MNLRAVHLAVLVLTFSACRGQPSLRPPEWPSAVALKPFERVASGCYRVHGVARSDSAETGFAADSILRLDAAILRVVVPPQGPDVREYVNEHPFLPRPPNFDTTWWVGHDGTLYLEWRTPRQSSKVYFYGGGRAELRTAGDSLVGQTTPFRDAGQTNHLAIALTRLRSCPDRLASDSGAT